MCTTIHEERPTARKPHPCNACGGVIGKGDRYLRQVNVDGGDKWVWRAHLLCEAIVRRDNSPYDDCIITDWSEMELSLREALSVLGRPA